MDSYRSVLCAGRRGAGNGQLWNKSEQNSAVYVLIVWILDFRTRDGAYLAETPADVRGQRSGRGCPGAIVDLGKKRFEITAQSALLKFSCSVTGLAQVRQLALHSPSSLLPNNIISQTTWALSDLIYFWGKEVYCSSNGQVNHLSCFSSRCAI